MDHMEHRKGYLGQCNGLFAFACHNVCISWGMNFTLCSTGSIIPISFSKAFSSSYWRRSSLHIWVVIIFMDNHPGAALSSICTLIASNAQLLFTALIDCVSMLLLAVFLALYKQEMKRNQLHQEYRHCTAMLQWKRGYSDHLQVWLSMVDCCIKMLPETIVGRFYIFEWHRN